MKMPDQGLTRDDVFARLEAHRAADMNWRSGRAWAYVYDAGAEAEQVCKQAFTAFLSENALDPTVFPSVVRLETELVAMMASHLNGAPDTVGNFTSGGTESIFMAVKSAREAFRARHPEVSGTPQILLPVTAHAAFQKAAHYLGLETVLTPVGDDFRADVVALRAAVGPRTALVVGSACSYAHGVVDDIPAIGALAAEHGIPCHVDACIGGFLLPYFERLGLCVTPWDFRVPGVTSMSVDLHKYAFAAKGASIILYRDDALRRHQIYACSTWSGYTIVNNTLQSSKSAGPMAAAWAVLHFLGDAGYLALARTMYAATGAVCEGIDAIPGLRVLVPPDSNLVAFTTTDPSVSVFHVVDEMKVRGWYVQPQLSYEGSPANIHLSVNPKSAEWVPTMLADLAASVVAASALPSGHLRALAPMLADQLREGGDGGAFGDLLGMVGVQGTTLPDRMAGINELLDALPPRAREGLLVEFANLLYR